MEERAKKEKERIMKTEIEKERKKEVKKSEYEIGN